MQSTVFDFLDVYLAEGIKDENFIADVEGLQKSPKRSVQELISGVIQVICNPKSSMVFLRKAIGILEGMAREERMQVGSDNSMLVFGS